MPKPPERLAALQKRFADHIRDPDGAPAPEGIEARRLAIYRRLFFNNLSSLFGANFPIPRKIVPDDRWRELIRAFMVEHRATTPVFPEIGREFVRFLADHPERHREWPWLAELCHWQFLATRVRIDEHDPRDPDIDTDADLVSGHPVVNPTLKLAQYAWPVHEIDVDRRPERPNSVVLAIFRKPDDHLGRMRVNAMTARLVEILQENSGITGQESLSRLAAETGHSDPDALIGHGSALLESLRDRSLLLGARAVRGPAT